MSLIQATMQSLARVLRCGEHHVESVVRDEPSARAALSRRGLFQAVGAVAAGSLFSLPEPEPLPPLVTAEWIASDLSAELRAFMNEFRASNRGHPFEVHSLRVRADLDPQGFYFGTIGEES